MKKFIVIASILLLLSLSVFAGAGVEWTTTIKTEGKGKKVNNDILTHTYAQGGNVKQVFESIARESQFQGKDSYWLFKSGDKSLYVVNTAKKTYMPLSIDAMLQMAGAMGQLVNVTIKDYNTNTVNLGRETLLGFKCDHLKITTDYTIKIKIAFIKKTMRMKEEREIWATHDIPNYKAVSREFIGKDLKTGYAELDELIRKQAESIVKIGFPLKVVTLAHTKNKKGKIKKTTTTTLLVTKIAAGNFKKTMFEIPQDYEEQEMPGSPF
ncbi:MAG: DUF4412 domain-containing protein [bacterium]|nr:DUF4412 domain-containing protein [bacterium]